MYTMVCDSFVEARDDSRNNIMGENHGFRSGFPPRHARFSQISVEESVRIPTESLLPEALFDASWSEP